MPKILPERHQRQIIRKLNCILYSNEVERTSDFFQPRYKLKESQQLKLNPFIFLFS